MGKGEADEKECGGNIRKTLNESRHEFKRDEFETKFVDCNELFCLRLIVNRS